MNILEPDGAALMPATPRVPGSYGRIEPPTDLVRYGNGRLPESALAPVGVDAHWLHGPAANAFRQLVATAQADGVGIGVSSAYRDLAGQERIAREVGLYSQGGLAPAPGTSNHGWGLSIDLDLDATAQTWMREHAWRFGFVEDVPREPWHWTYRPTVGGAS